MNFDNQIDSIGPRDIRRYASALERMPSRGPAKKVQGGRHPTYSEVAINVNGAEHHNMGPIAPAPGKNGKPLTLWEKDTFGFADFIDIINPLQHIPIVATIYRNFSGDQMGAAPRVIGGALWGRVGGFITGVANVLVEWWSGKDIGDHIYSALFNPASKDGNAVAVAGRRTMPGGGVIEPRASRGAVPPRTSESTVLTLAEAPQAVVHDSGAVPPNGSDYEPLPMTRSVRDSYEKHRKWGERDESLGIRLSL
jgi:hypothetical protein